jgi:hypothetical protein
VGGQTSAPSPSDEGVCKHSLIAPRLRLPSGLKSIVAIGLPHRCTTESQVNVQREALS